MKELIKTREERERDLYAIGWTNASNKPARNPFIGLLHVNVNDRKEKIKT